MRQNHNIKNSGFTLVELSLVLVIIGLLVGGIMVGTDLINAATIRAQINQIEKYQIAVNTFKLKYGYLPGDMPGMDASNGGTDPNSPAGQLGFDRGGLWTTGCAAYYTSCGDGNGIIENNQGSHEQFGEAHLFWIDLSTAHLIPENISHLSNLGGWVIIPSNQIEQFLPYSKLGGNLYIHVWSGGRWISGAVETGNNGINYFGLMGMGSLKGLYNTTSATAKVIDAYNIDKKADDGLPQSGNITAIYNPLSFGSWHMNIDAPNATPDTSTTCFNSTTKQYSTNVNGGNGLNCALSFKFQ